MPFCRVELGKQLAKIIQPELRGTDPVKGHDASTNAWLDQLYQGTPTKAIIKL